MVPIILLTLLLIVVAGAVIRRSAAAARAAEAAERLRLQILRLNPEDIDVPVSANEPFTVVMDLGYPAATVSVVSVMTGDASIYFSTGGGILGGIGHQSVRQAAVAFVTEAGKHMAHFVATSDFPFPPAGSVFFYAGTPNGSFVARATEDALQEGRDPLSELYAAGQNVITALRTNASPVTP